MRITPIGANRTGPRRAASAEQTVTVSVCVERNYCSCLCVTPAEPQNLIQGQNELSQTGSHTDAVGAGSEDVETTRNEINDAAITNFSQASSSVLPSINLALSRNI